MKAFNSIFAGLFLTGLLLGYPDQGHGAGATDAVQTVSGGSVTVKVTYLNPKAETPRFQLVLDTHSVGLDIYDLKNLTVLRDDSGKEYLPTAAENNGSGHHRNVTVTFPRISPDARHLELVVRDVAGVKERKFRWNVE